jgi:alpha-ketoglutarate-dependent 2,4-dichlorophenoxyacetate dioxygenase
MSLSIRQIHPVFVGEVSGVDCREPLGPDVVAAIEAGMDQYAVLVFRDQRITDEQQLAFTRQFGKLESYATPGHIKQANESRLAPGMADFSNLDKSGGIMSDQDRVWFFKLADRLWHSDSSFRPVPAKYSLLSGRIVVDRGGHTEFADMRAAYDALDDATKAEIEDLVCEHSLMYSRGLLGFTELTEQERAMFRPVRQKLVRTHPVTGRRSLFLSAHAGGIVGWPVPEARAFLRDLAEHATQAHFVYSHQWRQCDLLMWDNRQTMHRVTRFDETQVRDMRRTTVAGDTMTVAQTA